LIQTRKLKAETIACSKDIIETNKTHQTKHLRLFFPEERRNPCLVIDLRLKRSNTTSRKINGSFALERYMKAAI